MIMNSLIIIFNKFKTVLQVKCSSMDSAIRHIFLIAMVDKFLRYMGLSILLFYFSNHFDLSLRADDSTPLRSMELSPASLRCSGLSPAWLRYLAPLHSAIRDSLSSSAAKRDLNLFPPDSFFRVKDMVSSLSAVELHCRINEIRE